MNPKADCTTMKAEADMLTGMIRDSRAYDRHNHRNIEENESESLLLFWKRVREAYQRSSFYRDLYRAHGIGREDLGHMRPDQLPVVTKDMVRAEFTRISQIPPVLAHTPIKDRGVKLLPGIGYLVHTSGSTGRPARYLYSNDAVTAMEANFVRLSTAGGRYIISFRDFPIRSLHIAAVGSGYASMLILKHGLRDYRCESILIDAGTPLDSWPQKIGTFQPNYLSGYPSCIRLAAQLERQGRIDIHPRKIITGGEPMTRAQMNELAEVFGGDVINYYGCTESLFIGAGSSWYDGIYLFDDVNYLETDAMNRLIITPLVNPAFPLIRYQMNDIMEDFTRDYVPPLPYPHIRRIAGRAEDLLWFDNEDGRRDFLHPLFLDDLDVQGIEQYQFVQDSSTRFTIRCVSSQPDHAALEAAARRQIDGMLNKKRMGNVAYAFVFPDHLDPDPRTGKIRMVLSAGKQ
jgi:phenylacetate-CoA ligase